VIKRPIVFITISFIAGILFYEYSSQIGLPAEAALVMIISVLLLKITNQPILIIFIITGFLLNMFANSSMQNSLTSKLAAQKPYVKITGAVSELPSYRFSKTKFSINSEHISAFKGNFLTQERVQVIIKGKLTVAMGDRLSVSGKLARPRKNEKTSLFYKHISAVVIAKQSDVKKQKTTSLLTIFSNKLAQNIKKAIYSAASKDTAGLLLGMTLGNTNNMTPELSESFRKNGLFHLVAVSGTNIGLIALFVAGALSFFGISKRVQAITIIAFIVVYSFATGLPASVLRASIMAVIVMISWLLRIKSDVVSALFASMLILLGLDPFLIHDIGFQLSFGAALGIILLYKKIRDLPFLPHGFIGEAAALTISAQILILPIIAYYFNQISLVSVFSNVAAMGLVAPITNLAAFGGLIHGLVPLLSKFLMSLAAVFTDILIRISYYFSSIGWSSMEIGSPSPLQLAAYYSIIFFLIFLPDKYKFFYQKLANRISPAAFALILMSISAVYFWLPRDLIADKRAKVAFFDVGQADSALVRSPEGATLLIDGGREDGQIIRHLRKERVGRVNFVMISHFEEDHAGGIYNVLQNYPVDYVLISEAGKKKILYKRIMRQIISRHIDYTTAYSGQRWRIKDLDVNILSPEKSNGEDFASTNDESTVAKITYGSVSLLFTGDLESTGQQELCDKNLQLDSDILKVPHHGSADSANGQFLNKVSPKAAVISVGENNSYGHPSKKEIKYLLKHRIKIYRTDNEGSVYVYSDGKNFQIVSEK
jgi:competence protein ComEC